MVGRLASIVLLVAALAVDPAPGLSEPPRDAVQEDVRRLVQATYAGDVDTVLRLTHPALVRMLGGREAARGKLEESRQLFISDEVTLEAFAFPRPPEFLEGGGRRFAIVPTRSVIGIRGQRIESLNFQFGVLEAGAESWTYLEGSQLNQAIVQSLFPGFPADYVFPERQRRRL